MQFDERDFPEEDRIKKELSPDVQALISNGLDFLDKAREEMENSKPKFSIVSFWTAVEILLKVPLVHEHWTLVCSKKNAPKKQAYLNGDFQSVTYAETTALLREVLEKPLSSDTNDAFEKVRKHRNRVVHFYHPNFTQTEMQKILEEQADAWFRLNHLMRVQWRTIFDDALLMKLATDEARLLHTSHYYINAKFRALKDTLTKLVTEGSTVVECQSCRKSAAIIKEYKVQDLHTHNEVDCLVCGYVTDVYLQLTCPECTTLQRIEQGDETNFVCENCQLSMCIFDLLEDGVLTPEEILIMGGRASCHSCAGYECVCNFGDRYLCLQCLDLHESISVCEYCGGYSTHVQERSSLFGCSLCGGSSALYDD